MWYKNKVKKLIMHFTLIGTPKKYRINYRRKSIVQDFFINVLIDFVCYNSFMFVDTLDKIKTSERYVKLINLWIFNV